MRRGTALLIGAWILVLALVGGVAVWLSLGGSDETPHPAAHKPAAKPAAMVEKLSPAPDAKLIEPGRYGALPRTGEDGRKPWQVYARPSSAPEDKPRIALVMTGFGLDRILAGRLLQQLPAPVSIGISPYAPAAQKVVAEMRGRGHEVLVMAPMEPSDYPNNDPGPHTLRAGGDNGQNLDRLDWIMGQMTGYVGIVPDMGGKMLANADAMKPLANVLKQRGLLFIDTSAARVNVAGRVTRAAGVPTVLVSRVIDSTADAADIARRLGELESIAQTYGVAVGLASPLPVTAEAIMRWAAGLEQRGIALVPVSAVADKQMISN